MYNRSMYLTYCLCIASNFLYSLNSINKKLNNNFSPNDLQKEAINNILDANIKNSYDKELLKTLNNLIN